jgi:hypothetical protein
MIVRFQENACFIGRRQGIEEAKEARCDLKQRQSGSRPPILESTGWNPSGVRKGRNTVPGVIDHLVAIIGRGGSRRLPRWKENCDGTPVSIARGSQAALRKSGR